MSEGRSRKKIDSGGLRWRTVSLLVFFSLLGTLALASCGDEGSDESSATSEPSTAVTGTTEQVTQTVDLTALPLGDGKISTQPKTDNVYSCQTEFNENAGGAQADGPWIDQEKGTWNAKEKIAVPGKIKLDSEIKITVANGVRTISGNDFPTEPVGKFPVPEDSEAYQYDRNPNEITEQEYALELPEKPKKAQPASCLSLGAIGVLLDGSYFFNALDAPGRDAGAHEIQDSCDGHPEVSGSYHYHSLSSCVEDSEGQGHSDLVGYAIDGFGLYGHRGEDGETLANADLDKCHGHSHEIEWDGKQVEMYHYHATFEYPYTLGCYKGEPSESEDLGSGGPGDGGGAPPGAGAP